MSAGLDNLDRLLRDLESKLNAMKYLIVSDVKDLIDGTIIPAMTKFDVICEEEGIVAIQWDGGVNVINRDCLQRPTSCLEQGYPGASPRGGIAT